MQNEINLQPVLIEYPVPERENKLFSLLKGAGNKIKGFGENSKNLLSDLLLGKEVEEPETIIGDSSIQTGINNGGRQGGVASFVNDFTSGADENLRTPFSPQNLTNNKKGVGYKLGEAFGTGARLLDNSFIRGALAYGLSKRYGDNNPLEQGLMAMNMNMQNKTSDKIYRDSLINYEQDRLINTPEFANMDNDQKQAALNKIANQYNNIPGYINQNMFNSIQQAQQLRDNAEWRKAHLKAQQNQNKILDNLNREKFEYQKQQDKIQNAQNWEKINADKEKKVNKNITNLNAVSNQLARFEETFKTMPGKIESNTLGRLRNATGFQTPQEANFNSQRTLLFNKIARDLGGEKGVLSDQDIKRIEASLPNYTDSYEQKQAKMQAIYDLLEDRLSVEGVNLNNSTSQKDSLGIL